LTHTVYPVYFIIFWFPRVLPKILGVCRISELPSSICCSSSGWPQTCKNWNTRGFLWTWKT